MTHYHNFWQRGIIIQLATDCGWKDRNPMRFP